MEPKYSWAFIFSLIIVICVLSYIVYQNNKQLKKLNDRVNEPKKVEQQRSFITDRSLASAYNTPEIKNYYRAATVPERKWQKVGILTSDDKTMNLLARPSTYNEDVWQYRAEDRDGFVIDLGEMQTLRNGQVIPPISGKASAGSWTVSIYPRDTYYL